MTDIRFEDAAVLIGEVSESTELEALIAAAAPKANDFRQNLRNLRTSLLRMPAAISTDEARGQLDLLIFSATGSLASFADKLRAARAAL